ncbi:MAG: transcriptional activator protein [Gemmatimonadetes bacterium]|nr:transcriptional activator protein [Gemmatimonadota bacterium]
MIELRTLGTVDLVGDDRMRIDALLCRPKRLALLAYLATARADMTYRREKLLAMFWPEIDETRARGSLRQSVHVLRQHLGADALTALGDEELSLSRTLLRCDAAEFERAIREGRLTEALAMYGGEFLPGFFLDGAVEFDEWLESVRTRLRESATSAATQLAERAWLANDYVACIEAARRAVAIAPGDERATRRLISALDRTGDRGGAVSAYEVLAQRLHSDFEVLPSAETQALLATVRARDLAMSPMVDGIEQRPAQPTASESHSPKPRVAVVHRPIERYGRAVMRLLLVTALLPLSGARGRAESPVVIPIPPAAKDAYSRARFYLEKPTEANLRHAVSLFEQALDVEPLYAPAYAGLGDAYLRLGYGSYLAPSDAFPKALAAAHRAIELDSLAPEAHATLAFARMYYNWDWVGAEQEFRLATRLAPGYALAHEWYAILLTAVARDSEARREIDIAQHLAPLSVAVAVDAGLVLLHRGPRRLATQVGRRTPHGTGGSLGASLARSRGAAIKQSRSRSRRV